MKAHYRTHSGRLTLELEGDIPDIFAGIAQVQEVFEADTTCGCCGQANLRFRVRTVDENRFHEMVCLDCRATLSFGQTKRGNQLFAKRKDGEKSLPDRGWRVWASGASGGRQSVAGSKTAVSEPAPAATAKW